MKQEHGLSKIPIKNYVILGIIFIGVLLLLWYFSKWYEVYDDYQKETPVIRGTLSEITDLELDHYLMENPTSVIYMCTSSDMKCRNFEKSFKSVLESNENLKTGIIYLNLSKVDQDSFVTRFNETYPYKVKLNKSYPAIVLFEDNKIVGLLQEKKGEAFNINEVRSYLKLHKVGEK